MRKKIVIVLLVVGIVSSSLLFKSTLLASAINEKNSISSSIPSLIPHDPISITDDDDFIDYGFPGNGSETNPYLIEGYSFTIEAYSGIYIEKTTLYFVIQNCYVDGYTTGIYLNDVAKGKASIFDSTCVNNEDSGIIIQDSDKATLVNNTCKYSVFAGILLLGSSDTLLINNTCLFNYWGIGLEVTTGSYVFDNEFNFNTGYGLVMNVCFGDSFLNNSCTHNPTGIYLATTDVCIFIFNRIEKNTNYGIYLDSLSDGNTIHHNDFIRNNLAGNSQGFDDGTDNVFYDSDVNEGNYWSNYEGSGGYIIDGDAYSVDFYPLEEGKTPPDIPEYSYVGNMMIFLILSIGIIPFLIKKRKGIN